MKMIDYTVFVSACDRCKETVSSIRIILSVEVSGLPVMSQDVNLDKRS